MDAMRYEHAIIAAYKQYIAQVVVPAPAAGLRTRVSVLPFLQV